MLRSHRRSLLLAAALCLGLGSEAWAVPGQGKGPKSKKVDVQTMLFRPSPAPDADAVGSLRLRSGPQPNRHRLDVMARRIDLGTVHDLYVEDGVGSGQLVFVASLDIREGKTLRASWDTKKGDELPFAVKGPEDLVGREVAVMANGRTTLRGRVPALDASKKPARARVDLELPADAPEPSMKGRLFVRSKPDKGFETFSLHVRGVPPIQGRSFDLFVETEAEGGVFEKVGELVQLGTSDAWRYRRRSKAGQMLPFAAASVRDLGARSIELRDGQGVVCMRGRVPQL